MMASHSFTRVDTQELKDLIYQKIGQERAERYFDQLKNYLASKLSKVDFDKSCIQTIGRENIPLHNRLIRSIIKNALHAKIPPQKSRKVDALGPKIATDSQKNSLQSLHGDAFLQSPQRNRSNVVREHKSHDRPSPLGPLGKSFSIITCEETGTRSQEQQSETEFDSLCSKPPEHGEEVEEFPASSRFGRCSSSMTAPLGVSLNIGDACKPLRSGSVDESFPGTCQNFGELPDTVSLRNCLQKKLAMEGVGISMDCANLLNSSLDVYLKKIIEPCMSMAGSRCRDPRVLGRQLNNQGRQLNNKMMSGLNGRAPTRFGQRPMQPTYASTVDFCVAMESNPCIPRDNWPTQREKIDPFYALEE